MVMPKDVTTPTYTTFEHAPAFDSSRAERVDDEAFFRSQFPACDARLSQPGVRTWAPSTSDVFAITLNTQLALPGFLVYWDEPAGSPAAATPAQKVEYTPAASHLTDGRAEMVHEVHALLRTEKGLQAYPGILQGGIVSALMDEVTGLSTVVNRIRGVEGFRDHLFMTASVATRFAKPVPTPATLVVTARIKEVKGRVVKVEGEIRHFDNGGDKGPVLARVDAVWAGIKLKEGRPMLFKM
ncbi:Thioesterase superfamily [Microdochium nivale]|nr:Thioesterase superfamily [Microdochium nivale]